jgi:hypothetical protein
MRGAENKSVSRASPEVGSAARCRIDEDSKRSGQVARFFGRAVSGALTFNRLLKKDRFSFEYHVE